MTAWKEKHEYVSALLAAGQSAFVTLDSRRNEVRVPEHLKQHALTLQIGLNLRPHPIVDLTLDEFGIACTLSFNRKPFWCLVPWEAVWRITVQEGGGVNGRVWPADAPLEAGLGELAGVADLCGFGEKPADAPRKPSILDKMKQAAKKPAPGQSGIERKKSLPSGWSVIQGGRK